MKLKGINPLEQHVEKIVVAVFGVALLGLLAWQFVGPRNQVTLGTETVPLDQAVDVVARKAEEVQRRVTSKDPELPKDVPSVAVGEQFRDRFRGPVAPTKALAVELGPKIPQVGPGGDLVTTSMQFAAIQVPAVSAPVVMQYAATIGPEAVRAYPELAALLPKEQPYDKAWVTVEGTFNGQALAEALSTDPDGDGPLDALPKYWWDNNIQILRVDLYREELQPDGSYSNLTVVPALPGQTVLTFTGATPGAPIQLPVLQERLKAASDNADDIRRPEFFPTVMGPEWVAPTEFKLDGQGKQQEIDRLRREEDKLKTTLAQQEKLLQEIPAGDEPRNKQRRAAVTKKIEEIRSELSQVYAKLRAAGETVEGDPQNAEPVDLTAIITAKPLLQDPAVRIWAHDITAERGKTYRYRLGVTLNNPVFGRDAALTTEQAPLAKSPTVASAESQWTDDVALLDSTTYFIVNAQENDTFGSGPSATAEVYVFYWGYYRKGTISMQPGDPLAGEVRVPDLEKQVALAPAPDEELAPPPESTPRPDGGRGIQQPETAPRPQGDNPSPDGAPQPPVRPTYKEILFERDEFLLDVASAPSQANGEGTSGAAGYQAYMRDTLGEIVIKLPVAERGTAEYAMVTQSYAIGEQELRPRKERPKRQPKPKEEENKGPGGGGKSGPGRGGGGG